MATVQFRNLRTNDISPSLTVEELFRRYGSYSGVHDFKFNTLVDEPSIVVTGLTGGVWTIQEYDTSLPANFIVKYHKTDYRQALFIFSDVDPYYLILGTDSNGYPELRYALDVIAQTIPKVTPEEADVEVIFRQQQFDDSIDNPIVWKSVSLYMNGEWITTLSTQTTLASSDMRIGFCAYGTDEITYTNIQVPELCETSDITNLGALDPGEFPISGLQRNIEGFYINYFSRFDGSIRAWKKKQRDTVLVLQSDLEGLKRGYSFPDLITHARMMGAFVWAEAIDTTLMSRYGHRPREVNNSMLMTVFECHEQAVNEIKRSEETCFTFTTQARHIPILEPEDRITIDGDDWVINDYSLTAARGRLVQTYNCRRYVWGS